MRKMIINLTLVLTSIAIVLLMLEAALRISGYSIHVENLKPVGREREFAPLPGVRYLYKGHTSYTGSWPDDPRGYFGTNDHSLVYRVNNYGFRGDDLDISRNHRIRIAVIGDSFCWGNGVKEKDRFTALIEDQLNQNKILDQAYEVYNFCMTGFNSENEVALYEQVIRYFQPDLLLVSYFLNDVNLPPDLYFRWRAWEPGYLKEWRERFYLVDWVVFRISGIKTRLEFIASVNEAYERGHPGYESVIDGFERIALLNDKQGVPTVIAIFPWLTDLDQDTYPFHKAHLAVQQASETQGFKVVDLLNVFVGQQAEDMWVYPIDHHPNEVGHRFAAEAIYKRLVDVLIQSGDDLLSGADYRRGTQIPLELRASPKKEWYKVFAKLTQEKKHN